MKKRREKKKKSIIYVLPTRDGRWEVRQCMTEAQHHAWKRNWDAWFEIHGHEYKWS